MRQPANKRSAPGQDAQTGTWLYFRLLANANPARAGVAVWSAQELVAAACAAGLHATSSAAYAAIKSVLLARGLVERAGGSTVGIAWRLSPQARRKAPCSPGPGAA